MFVILITDAMTGEQYACVDDTTGGEFCMEFHTIPEADEWGDANLSGLKWEVCNKDFLPAGIEIPEHWV